MSDTPTIDAIDATEPESSKWWPLVFGLIVVGGIALAIVSGMSERTTPIIPMAIAAAALVALLWAFAAGVGGKLRAALITALVVALISVWLSGAVRAARQAALRNSIDCNLKQFGLALANYQDKHGAYPPRQTRDSAGNPLHSWRALVLPEMEQSELHDRLDFDRAWNDPVNADLTNKSVSVFHGPCGSNLNLNHTKVVAIHGHDTIWENPAGGRSTDITDGTSKTIALIHMHGSTIPWAEPRDIDWRQFRTDADKRAFLKSLADYQNSFGAVFCDGHTENISSDIPIDQFEAMLTKSGGEKIDYRP